MISNQIIQSNGNKKTINNVVGCAIALTIEKIILNNKNNNILIVAEDTKTANRLVDELQFLLPNKHIYNFSDYETLPYDSFSPQQELISNRLEALFILANSQNNIIVSSVSACMLRCAPKSYINKNVFVVNKGQQISMENLIKTISATGYTRVSQVYAQGEFSVRGSILDLFPSGQNHPFRIDFFDDEIDSIRLFDIETQRTKEIIDCVRLLPAREFPIQNSDIENFRKQYREEFGSSLSQDSIYQQITNKTIPAGIEYYLPLFYQQTETIFDYLNDNSIIVLVNNIEENASKFIEYVKQRYTTNTELDLESNNKDLRPKLKPEKLYITVDKFFELAKQNNEILLKKNYEPNNKNNLLVKDLPSIVISSTIPKFEKLKNYISQNNCRILFSAYSAGRLDTILDLLKEIDIIATKFQTIEEFTKSTKQFGIIVTPFDEGLYFEDSNIAFITESELFGNSYVNSKRKNKNVQVDAVIRNLAELKIGEKIVHYKYGIGCYQGLEIQNINGINKEFFCLEYAESAKLYVEITELHLISRYTGGANPPLNKLGSNAWVKNREKAQKKVKDVAVQLLDIYSKRATKTGFQFKFDRKNYNNFITGFPYTETEDQKRAIESVISDMTSPKTMDRLICGDVGFGKTEVAIRAAFIAISNNKQVSILVPTVLLAEQHYESFKSRFSNEAVNIEVISRFKTSSEQKTILQKLADGKIDIIIGTHKLLSKEIVYKDLGLLIVDEEHRFGVKQKEIIKEIRANIDILTLTATPIPRTLNMAFSGLRDLSLITTPPAKRLAIKTFLKPMEKTLIKEAIIRELKRGGQVYFLHNDVDTINNRAEDIANLVPEAKIEVAHGQMNERQLSIIMNNFYHQKFNVLVCTTIIETGIDVPTANTIIIERADKFGLAQLHQIRGRVGRSTHQAYAYLLTPPPKLITKDAIKRLEAISMHDDLGVGFALANHDLEIRGAGEILGDEQSGQIATVGFNLYMEMLNNAIEALKQGEELSLMDLTEKNTEINLNISAIIPKTYIGDISTRLLFYKRLASINKINELIDIKEEMIDRFGEIPKELNDLFEINKIRIKIEPFGIQKICFSNITNFIEFSKTTSVDPKKIVLLIQNNPDKFRFEGTTKIKILTKVEPENRLNFLIDLIDQII